MSSGKDDSLIARAQASYEKLAAAAKSLNTVSDQLGQTVVELDAALKRLNIGVSTWTSFAAWEEFPHWTSDDLGYAKIDGKWGLAIRSTSGNYERPEEDDSSGEWLFNDAPRALRLQAVDKIPDLLEALVKKVADFTEKLSTKLKKSQELSAAISSLVNKANQVAKPINAVPCPPKLDPIPVMGSARLASTIDRSAVPPPSKLDPIPVVGSARLASTIDRSAVPPPSKLDPIPVMGSVRLASTIDRSAVPFEPMLDAKAESGDIPSPRDPKGITGLRTTRKK